MDAEGLRIVGTTLFVVMLVGGALLAVVGILAVTYRVRRLRFATGALSEPKPRVSTSANGERIVVIPTMNTMRFRTGARPPLVGQVARSDEVLIRAAGVEYHAFHLLQADRRRCTSFAEVVEVDAFDAGGDFVFVLRLPDGHDLGFRAASREALDTALIELERTCRLTPRAQRRIATHRPPPPRRA